MKMKVAAASAAVVLQAAEVLASKWGARADGGNFLRAPRITAAMAKTLLSTTYNPENPIKGSRLDEENCMEPNEPEYEIEPYSGSFGPEKIHCCRTAKTVIANLEKRCMDCHDAVPCTADMEEKYCPDYLARYKEMKANVCRPMDYPPTTTTTAEPASKEKASAEAEGKDGGEAKKKGKGEKTKDEDKKGKGDGEGKGEGKGEGEGGKDKDGEKDGKKDAKDDKKDAKADDAKDGKKDAKDDKAAKEGSKDDKKAKEDEAGDKSLAWCVKMCVEVAQGEKCKDEAKCEKFCKEAEPKFAKMKKKKSL